MPFSTAPGRTAFGEVNGATTAIAGPFANVPDRIYSSQRMALLQCPAVVARCACHCQLCRVAGHADNPVATRLVSWQWVLLGRRTSTCGVLPSVAAGPREP